MKSDDIKKILKETIIEKIESLGKQDLDRESVENLVVEVNQKLNNLIHEGRTEEEYQSLESKVTTFLKDFMVDNSLPYAIGLKIITMSLAKTFGANWLAMTEDKHNGDSDLMEKEFKIFLLDFISDISSYVNDISRTVTVRDFKHVH